MKEISFSDSQKLGEARKEAKLMQEIKHRYVTQYIDSFVHAQHLYLVMEYCQKGDLSNYLSRCMVQNTSLSNSPRAAVDGVIDFNF